MKMYGVGYDEHGAAYPVGQVVKVGDKIRVVKSGWPSSGEEEVSFHCADIGDTDTVIAIKGGRIEGNEWFYLPSEIELIPSFSPNDRLRLKRHTATLAAGDIVTVTEVDGYGVYATCINGRSHYIANDAVEVAPKTLPITLREFTEDLTAPNCAERKVEQAKPKFKAGDKVRTTEYVDYRSISAGEEFVVESVDYEGVSTTNHFYLYDSEIELVSSAGAPWPLANEEQGWSLKSSDGSFTITADKFIISLQPTPQPAIVALISNGKPRPSQWPHLHASVESATTEAERLAKNNPGQEFAVFQRVAGRVCEVSYSMKEVA